MICELSVSMGIRGGKKSCKSMGVSFDFQNYLNTINYD